MLISTKACKCLCLATSILSSIISYGNEHAAALQSQAGIVESFHGKPRVFVLTDIGNEPDDQMSMTRFLLYSNEFDIEGLVATTSTWQRNKISADIIHRVLSNYGKIRSNLPKHADGFPSLEYLSALVKPGQPAYGMAAVGDTKMSPGAGLLIEAVDRNDPRPVYVSIWGGANTLAQALWHVRETRGPEEVRVFISKLRVYSISDQDDAGHWIRREFPELFYIVNPSTQDGEEYRSATWTGISGDKYYRNAPGADFTTVSNSWLDEHVRNKGSLGETYPQYLFIMEGDTPAFFGLIDNGLASYRNPGWGGWGGATSSDSPRESHGLYGLKEEIVSREAQTLEIP
jgi:cellulose-binding protein